MEYLQGESKYVEYKRVYTKTLLKTVSAFANYHDGTIIIGIDDHGEIIGIDRPEEVRLNIEHAIHDNLEPAPFYEMETVLFQDKQLVVLKVFKGDNTPYTCSQKAYRRMDTSTVQVDRRAYEALILEGRNLSYEELPSENEGLFFELLEKRLKQNFSIRQLTDDLLATLGLRVSGKYNHAAALLSDGNPVHSAGIQLVAYADDTVREIKDRQILEGISVIEQFDRCMEFYRKHINIRELIDGPYRRTIEEVPLIAYREAIANMIVHRDYMLASYGRVEIFRDRIEIMSPGGLPAGLSEQEFVEGRITIARNQILTDIFLRLKIIEKLATGVRRIRENYREYRNKPAFHAMENSVLIILPKVKPDDRTIRSEMGDRLDHLMDNERVIYDIVSSSGPISRRNIEEGVKLKKSQTAGLIKGLRDRGLIVQIGNGRAVQYKKFEQ